MENLPMSIKSQQWSERDNGTSVVWTHHTWGCRRNCWHYECWQHTIQDIENGAISKDEENDFDKTAKAHQRCDIGKTLHSRHISQHWKNEG